jgi:hypothetical protein
MKIILAICRVCASDITYRGDGEGGGGRGGWWLRGVATSCPKYEQEEEEEEEEDCKYEKIYTYKSFFIVTRKFYKERESSVRPPPSIAGNWHRTVT